MKKAPPLPEDLAGLAAVWARSGRAPGPKPPGSAFGNDFHQFEAAREVFTDHPHLWFLQLVGFPEHTGGDFPAPFRTPRSAPSETGDPGPTLRGSRQDQSWCS